MEGREDGTGGWRGEADGEVGRGIECVYLLKKSTTTVVFHTVFVDHRLVLVNKD